MTVAASRKAASAGALVLGALLVWNIGNYAFFLLAGRLLGVDDYGLLAALLGFTVVIAVPASAFQMELARQVGAHGREEGAAVLARAAAAAAWIAPAICVALALGVVALSFVLDIPATGLVLTLAVIAPMPVLFLALGQLQGEHRFGAFSGAFSIMGGARPLLLLPLVLVLPGVIAGLGATFGAMAGAAALALIACRGALRERRPVAPAHWSELRTGVPVLALGLAGIAVLTNVDVIAARIWLTPEQAGQFAAVAVLAKAVIVVPQAASTVLLPRVATRGRNRLPAGELLAIGVLLAAGAALVGVVVGLVAAEPLIALTFGEEFTGLSWLLAPFAAASGMLGAMIVLVNHHVGRRSLRFAWGMGGLAVAYMIALAIAHDSAGAIVAVNAIIGFAGLVMHEILFARQDDSMLRGMRALVHNLRHGGLA